jgi:hypothetical protein
MDTFHDWIAPGEIRYCGRCGWHLVPAGKTACRNCDPPPLARHADGTLTRPPGPSAESVHGQLLAAARQMAEDRRAAGVRPLFWVGA